MSKYMIYPFLLLIAYVAVLQVLRIIFILFQPKFMNPDRFGPPKTKFLMFSYYLVTLYFLITIMIEKIQAL